MNNIKHIHIGQMILERWKEMEISMERTTNFIEKKEEEIYRMFDQATLDSGLLLRWSKLLEYDFFRLYSHHLILYAPKAAVQQKKPEETVRSSSSLPEFRKHVYTKEVIDYLLKLIDHKEKTPAQIITEYRIPKTTLYKWMNKYRTTEKKV